MQKSSNGILYSASDLADFLLCKHLISLKRIDLDTPLVKDESGDQSRLLQDKGFQHEANFLNSLRDQGLVVAEIDVKGKSRTQKIQESLGAMQQGADVIYQATLLQTPFLGIPDFLYKVEVPSVFGNWSYEVADIKLATHPKARHLMQVGLYSSMLSEVQGVMPGYTHLVMGNKKIESFRLLDFSHYVNFTKQRFLLYASEAQDTYPNKCAHCDLCVFKSHCIDQWDRDDHLNRVANIRKTDIKYLNAAGIQTLAALAENGDPSVNPIPKLGSQAILWQQAVLQHNKQRTGKDVVVCKELDPVARSGFYRLPLANEGDLYFDMEGYPLEEGGLEYLFGVSWHENGDLHFKPFWAHNRKEEKLAFEGFIDFVMARIALFPDLHIYHYADYERRALQYLMGLHGTREREVDSLLRSQKLVDLYAVVRYSILTSEPKYSIKNLETFYMKGERAADVKNAGASIVYYEKWKNSQDPAILEEIRQYNEEDCRSTFLLHEWLITLRPSDLPWYTPSAVKDEVVDPDKEARIVEAEALRDQYREALTANLPEDLTLWIKKDTLNQLLFDLLDFYRREDKPGFWRMYDRQGKLLPDLLEDLDCLAGLTLEPKCRIVADKQSFIVTYHYPEQDHRLLVRAECQDVHSLMTVGEIHRLDDSSDLVEIRVGPKVMNSWNHIAPQMLTLAASKIVPTKILQAALCRYIDSYIAGEDKYAAITAFLRRDFPDILGRLVGEPIVLEGQSASSVAVDVIPKLNSSYLFIQGPPGSGKTYTGAKAIVALLKLGKRVAVCANSHKVIVHVLKAVATEAKLQQLTFVGAKKGVGESETLPKDIFTVTDNIHEPRYQLVGGTAWAMASPKMDQAVDYLFIDEAGQVSLPNLIAMSVCAGNIVLLGDHMQLSQPLQGVHPNDSGQSALEYLLESHATIPPDRGVFLDITWRMHPDVCQFISDAVYDSKLLPQSDNVKQQLILNQNSHVALKPAGITFYAMDHDGCAQTSKEEARAIKEFIDSLLQQQYIDRAGIAHPITTKNILVVAPYNAQVKTLRNILPPEVEVGTVDKFQGLEAEVVIVSMTTSSEECMPRYMEFLYNKNRLNVAVSRARTLAIVLANPKLLEIDCSTPEQMQLVNTLCWLKEYAGC